MAQQHAGSTDKPITEIRDIFTYFHTPENLVQIHVANDKTLYAWQNLSASADAKAIVLTNSKPGFHHRDI